MHQGSAGGGLHPRQVKLVDVTLDQVFEFQLKLQVTGAKWVSRILRAVGK